MAARPQLDAHDRKEAVAAMRRSMPSLRWKYELTEGGADLQLPGHSTIHLPAPRRVSWLKRNKAEATLYEPAAVHCISALLGAPGVSSFFDIGAADGFLSLIAASREPRPAFVDAFEMAPIRCEAMRRALARNPDLSVALHNVGLSDRALGVVPIWYYKNDMYLRKPARAEYDEGLGRKIKYYLRGTTDEIRLREAQIRIESLDSFCGQTEKTPAFLKIDVDGYEAKILPGGRATFETLKPFVLLELHRNELLSPHGTDRRAVATLMFDLGYRGLLISGHNKLSTVEMHDIDRSRLDRLDRDTTDLVLFY